MERTEFLVSHINKVLPFDDLASRTWQWGSYQQPPAASVSLGVATKNAPRV